MWRFAPLLDHQIYLLQKLIQLPLIIKMLSKAFNKISPRIIMALSPVLLQTIDSRQRTDLTAQLPIEAARVTSQEAAAKSIANTSRIHDLIFGNGWDVNRIASDVEVCPIFPACNDQHFDMFKELVKVPVCFLGDQSEFVIVAE